MDTKTKTITCKVCGFGFFPDLTRHYISRNTSETGVMAAFNATKEPTLFDSFDCPACGSQIIVQEHKRRYDGKENPSDEELIEDMDAEVIAKHLDLTPESIELLRKAAKAKTPFIPAYEHCI